MRKGFTLIELLIIIIIVAILATIVIPSTIQREPKAKHRVEKSNNATVFEEKPVSRIIRHSADKILINNIYEVIIDTTHYLVYRDVIIRK